MERRFLAAGILAIPALLLWRPADAAMIQAQGVFTVEVVDTPQPTGSGFFDVRSPFWDPNVGPDEDPTPPSDWEVLDFEFTFLGVTWDESDISVCDCQFDEFGQPDSINFFYDGPKGQLVLSWSFEDGNFGFSGGGFGGTSENGEVSGVFDSFSFFLVPEPSPAWLCGLALAGLLAARRRDCRCGSRRARPPDRPHLAAPSSAAEEPIAAVGFQS
jgi:hypothetical protein